MFLDVGRGLAREGKQDFQNKIMAKVRLIRERHDDRQETCTCSSFSWQRVIRRKDAGRGGGR